MRSTPSRTFDQSTPNNLQAFAISSEKRCVTDAQALIGAVTDKAAMDKIGFALNTVGPIALIANAHAGFPTNTLQQHIISANQDLKARLAPFCDVSIDDPNSLPGFGEGAVSGHGACYNFHHLKPARIAVGERGGVFYLQQGPNTAFLSWPMRGDAVPDDDLIPWRGYTVGFPVVDFSIAIRDVMQGTSWQVADTALNALEPAVARIGPPVTLTVSAGIEAFRTDSSWQPDRCRPETVSRPLNAALLWLVSNGRLAAVRDRGRQCRWTRRNLWHQQNRDRLLPLATTRRQ